jgi:hypothetical protein
MTTQTRTVTCSMCQEPGHNCRTCWMRNVTFRGTDIPVWDETLEDIEMVEPYDLTMETPPPTTQFMTPPPAPKKRKKTKTPKRPKPYIQEENHCNICFDDLEDTNKVITKCGHKFCVECYTRAARNKNDCAVCRKKLCSVEPDNWKRRYQEMEQDCEYYRNIVERMTGVLGPHMLDTDSLPGDSDIEMDEADIEYLETTPMRV